MNKVSHARVWRIRPLTFMLQKLINLISTLDLVVYDLLLQKLPGQSSSYTVSNSIVLIERYA